jgi:flagellar biosynthesis chaperone FliJ
VRDLLRRQRETARRVEDDVDRHVVCGEPQRAQELLAVLDVDVAQQRKAEDAHRLLPVDERD